MERADVQAWVERYTTAWRTNDRDDIAGLFTEDARYYTEPDADPWSGRDEIVRCWLDRKDDPGDWEFRFEVLGADGDLGFVRGWARYRQPPREYSNLWVIRLDDGDRCSEFVEWWMQHERAETG